MKIVIIINNGTLGFVEPDMKAGGFLGTGTELVNPDFAKVAQRLPGYSALRVEDPGT